jgi:hypothetical protein
MKKFMFPYRARRVHFKHKIYKVENEINALKKERYEIDAQRSRLTAVMKREQSRRMDLQLERDRIKSYRGDWITSSVLHGSEMRYTIEEFVQKVELMWEKCLATIAEARFTVIKGENRKAEIKIELETAEELLKERTAAFRNFKNEHDKALKAAEKLQLGGGDEQCMKFFFERLRAHMNTRKSSRAKVAKLFQRAKINFLRSAFVKWNTGEEERVSSNVAAFSGVGSLLLQKAKETRNEIQVKSD